MSNHSFLNETIAYTLPVIDDGQVLMQNLLNWCGSFDTRLLIGASILFLVNLGFIVLWWQEEYEDFMEANVRNVILVNFGISVLIIGLMLMSKYGG